MIVYNVGRRWFTMKNEAEAHRRGLGLKPDATFKLTIHDRDQLAALLNGLCGLEAPAEPAPAAAPEAVAPPEIIARNRVAVPDFVPDFLLRDFGLDPKATARTPEAEFLVERGGGQSK